MPALCLCYEVHEPYRLRRYTVFDMGQNSVYEDDDRNCDALLLTARACYLPMNDLLLKLIRRYGIRVSELGDYSMEYDLKTPEQQAEVCNVVRFAIDRSRLTKEHLDYVIAAVKALYEDRENIPNMRIVWGHNLPMRHFHAFLEPYPNEEK